MAAHDATPVELKAAADALPVLGLNNDQVFELTRAVVKGSSFATASASPRVSKVQAAVLAAWQSRIASQAVSKPFPGLND